MSKSGGDALKYPKKSFRQCYFCLRSRPVDPDVVCLLVSLLVAYVEKMMTPSDQVTKWPSDQMTEWPSDQMTEWPSNWVTERPSDQMT